MKKTLIIIVAILMSISFMFVIGGCEEKEEEHSKSTEPEYSGSQSEHGKNHQLGDVVIPPGAEREREGGWHSSSGSSSGDGFSITVEGDDDDIIIVGEQTFVVDQDNGEHSLSDGDGDYDDAGDNDKDE